MSTTDSALSVRLSSSYRIDRVDRLIGDLLPLIELEEPRRIELDLGGLVSVSPAALALLTAVLKRLDEDGLYALGSVLLPPRSTPVRNYLLRMGLLRLLMGEAYPAEPFERRPAVGFRPCQEFREQDQCHAVAADLTDALAERCNTDTLARFSIRICLDELAENVIQHADTPLGGFAAAQGWLQSQQFEIGIVDLGVGIQASLRKNPAFADIGDDLTAIQTALEPRVTSTPERNSGIGLFITKLLLRANGGVLLVRSGNAAVYAGAQEDAALRDVRLPGTLVALRARTDRPLNIKEVYRQLPDDQDGRESRVQAS